VYRIDNPTSVPQLPIVPAPATPGFFTNGQAATAFAPTRVDDWWLNMVQEEILTVVLAAGLTPNKASTSQLYEAIQAIAYGTNPDLSAYLPLSGGTLANPGNLTVAGALTGLASANVAGNVSAGSLNVAGAATIAGALTGYTTANIAGNLSAGSLNVAGTTIVGGALQVSGLATFSASIRSMTVLNHLVCYGANGISDGTNSFGFWSAAASCYFSITDANGSPIRALSRFGPDGFQVYEGSAWKPDGGPWLAPASDRRVKTDVAGYDRGLDAICRLQPVRYRFNGLGDTPRDDDRTRIGLIADDVIDAMPEMVGERLGKLSPDDPDDVAIKTLDTGPLTYALVNAVKELAAKITALEQNGTG
jgi:hypothetical protein